MQFDKEYKRKRSFKRAFKNLDDYYTPSVLIDCLIPFLKKWESEFILQNDRKPVLWLPFDEEKSKYYQILKANDFTVIRSHINEGKDFLKYQPDDFDLIVSNPPFSLKLVVFERIILDLKKPFVLLMNMMAINYQEIGNLFQFVGSDIQFIIPDKKVSFDGHTSSFCSGYVCYKFIDKTIFINLPDNNSGKFYRP